MSNLVPIVIRLPQEDLERYKSIAFGSKVSFSGLVREALDESFPDVFGKTKGKKKKKLSFWDIGKIAVKGGPRDGSVNHDYYLNRLIEEQRG